MHGSDGGEETPESALLQHEKFDTCKATHDGTYVNIRHCFPRRRVPGQRPLMGGYIIRTLAYPSIPG